MNNSKLEVIEVDQWTSTGIKNLNFKTLKKGDVNDGDAKAAKDLDIATFVRKSVRTDQEPEISRVWYIEGLDGNCLYYKGNFDTSD